MKVLKVVNTAAGESTHMGANIELQISNDCLVGNAISGKSKNCLLTCCTGLLLTMAASGKETDEFFHSIFDQLYDSVKKEKSVYLRTTNTSTSRSNPAAEKLLVAARALRVTVEAGAALIAFRTASSVFDHIVDTLILNDGTFCGPLQQNYIKSFRTLLDYASHGEHLRPKQWQSCVDFAIDCLSILVDESTNDEHPANSKGTSSSARDGLSMSIRLSQRSQRSTGLKDSTMAEQAVAILRSLTSITNAPIMTRASEIAEIILSFLSVAMTGQDGAFETLNQIFLVSLSEDVSFTRTCFSDLLPIVRRLWPTRSINLREQMLNTLYTCRFFFAVGSSPWKSVDATLVEPLYDVLISDYSTRHERDMLGLDDLQLSHIGDESHLRVHHFRPIRSSAKAVNCWLLLEVLGSILSGRQRNLPHHEQDPSLLEAPRKRFKGLSFEESLVDLALEKSGSKKVAALQVLWFRLNESQQSIAWCNTVKKLSQELNSDDSTTQCWVLLLFSR
jgi:serine-protein kinase ATM